MRRLGLALLKKCKFLRDPFYAKVYYEYYTGKKLDLENPVEFNQKIHWMKVYYRPKILNQLVDKYAVREYVEEKIGPQYLNELIALYNSASEVDFDALPQQYVLKGTHGFHFNLIVPDKSKLNLKKARFLLRKWQMKNQYWRGGKEWAYKDVPPRFIAEKFLAELGKEEIADYKFYCFNGEPKFVQVDEDRSTEHRRAYYNMKWEKQAFSRQGNYQSMEDDYPKPPAFDEMVEVSRKLADRFPFVRVDLYNIDGRILFGEMTFYPADGRNEFLPDEYNAIIGSYIQLPEIPAGKPFRTEI